MCTFVAKPLSYLFFLFKHFLDNLLNVAFNLTNTTKKRMSEWVSEWERRECECVSQWVSEWVSEWASEWGGEWVDDSRSLLLWLTFPVVPLQFSHQSVSRVSVDRYQVPHEMIACRLRYETEKREGGKLPNVTNPEHQSNNVTSVQVLLHQLTNL